MSTRGVWALTRRSFACTREGGESFPRVALAWRPAARQAHAASCESRRCIHSSRPRVDPKRPDEGDADPTADGIFTDAETHIQAGLPTSSTLEPKPRDSLSKWGKWRARFNMPPSADRDFGWDAERPRHLIPDFKGTTAERRQQSARTNILRVENFPRNWPTDKILHSVNGRLEATVPHVLPAELLAVRDRHGVRSCVLRFLSMEQADAARMSLVGYQLDGQQRLDAYFNRNRVHSPGGHASGEDVRHELSEYSDPKLSTIRIVGLTDSMSMRKIRSLFTHNSMPLPHPVHYFLYRRAPLPDGRDSVMAVVVYAPGTDVSPHLQQIHKLFRHQTVHIAAHQPFSKMGPTRPGARVALTDYPPLTSLYDFFMAFSHVAPVEYVRFSGGQATKCFAYIDFADEADAMVAATYHNRLMGKHRIWAHRVSGLTHVDNEVAEAKAAATALQAGLMDLPDPSSEPMSGEQTLMELHP